MIRVRFLIANVGILCTLLLFSSAFADASTSDESSPAYADTANIDELTDAVNALVTAINRLHDELVLQRAIDPEMGEEVAERRARDKARVEALERVKKAHGKAHAAKDHFRVGAYDRMVKLAREKNPPAKEIDKCREFIISRETDKCEKIMSRW